MLNLRFVSSVSFSESWRHQFVCYPKWSDLLDGQRDADTDLQWPRGNSGRHHTGTLTSQVFGCSSDISGVAIHRYADFSGVVLGFSAVNTRGRQYTGTLISQVLYRDFLQSYQGKAIHRYVDFSGVVLGCSSVISGILRYADFSGVVLGCSSVIPGEGNTQVR